jgi:hypothetical protein
VALKLYSQVKHVGKGEKAVDGIGWEKMQLDEEQEEPIFSPTTDLDV